MNDFTKDELLKKAQSLAADMFVDMMVFGTGVAEISSDGIKHIPYKDFVLNEMSDVIE